MRRQLVQVNIVVHANVVRGVDTQLSVWVHGDTHVADVALRTKHLRQARKLQREQT